MRWWLVLACVVQWVWCCAGYHVLVVYPVPSRSHNNLGKGIVDALLQAGHEVSWATPYPPEEKVKGLNIIDISATQKASDNMAMDPHNAKNVMQRVIGFSRNITKFAINSPAFKEALYKGKFDAVVTEHFFSDTDAGYAAVLKVPWIEVNSMVMMPNFEQQVDEVRSVSTIPLLFNSAPIPMSFWDRLKNTAMYTMMTAERWFDRPNVVSFYEKLFAPIAAARGTTLPPFEDAFYNVSVMLVNSHSSYAPAMSLPPNVIEIGGYHIQEQTPPLPKDLQELLDSSSQGVVYFSMGSVMKSADFPAETKQELLQIFGKMPYTVLWKFEEQLEGRPKNVHIRPWMPQASILAHPNVKVFITHGGLLSTLEALHSGVPLLAVPMFGDQPANADRAMRAGYARTVSFRADMAQELKETLNEMLTNDSYYKKAKYLSKLFRNRPVAPKKLVSHYVELAIESKGAYHLRSKSQLYSWYQRWMLDQLAALLLLLALLYLAARALLRICCNKLWGNNTTKLKKQKKN